MISRTHLPILIVAFVTIACLAPFANKAFNVDDPLFIWTAGQIQSHPLDFYGFSVNWYTTFLSMCSITQNPPLASYYIALAALPFGFNEIFLHLAFLLPALAAAFGTYFLASRFCSRPALAALAAVLTPAFLVSASTIMCDIMMLAFWLWALVLWIKGLENENHLALVFASFLVAVCCLTKYFGIALIPLIIVYTIFQKRKFSLTILYLIIPIAFLAAYQWLTFKLYGQGLLTAAANYALQINPKVMGTNFFEKLFTGLIFTGGCSAVAFFYCPVIFSKRTCLIGAASILLLFLFLTLSKKFGLMPLTVPLIEYINWGFFIQVALMTVTGFAIVFLAFADFFKNKNAASLLLLLWVLGTFIFAVFINWSINARSILPMSPAIGILLMRRLELARLDISKTLKPATENVSLIKSAWPLLPAAIVSLLVCWADYSWAGTQRKASNVLQQSFEKSKQTVWYQGHWGFQIYMESWDARSLDVDNLQAVKKDDIIVVPQNNANTFDLSGYAVFRNYALQIGTCPFAATMNSFLAAGFYSNAWGPLPFAFGRTNSDIYDIYIVQDPQKLSKPVLQ